MLQADLTVPHRVLDEVDAHLDLTRPVVVLAVAVLHFVDDDVPAILRAYRDATVAGSVLAISHGSADQDDPEVAVAMEATQEGYRTSASPVHLRDRDVLARAFEGYELVEPAMVDVVDWPEPTGERPVGGYALVGRRL